MEDSICASRENFELTQNDESEFHTTLHLEGFVPSALYQKELCKTKLATLAEDERAKKSVPNQQVIGLEGSVFVVFLFFFLFLLVSFWVCSFCFFASTLPPWKPRCPTTLPPARSPITKCETDVFIPTAWSLPDIAGSSHRVAPLTGVHQGPAKGILRGRAVGSARQWVTMFENSRNPMESHRIPLE